MIARARRWLNPHPDTSAALRLGFAAAYIGVVGALVVYSNFVSPCDEQLPLGRRWGLIALVALLLFVERFELTRNPQPAPRRLSVWLLLARVALVWGAALLDCTRLALLLYPIIPFAVFFTLGIDMSRLVAIGFWLLVLVQAWKAGVSALQAYFNSLTIVVVFTLLLIFMQVIAGNIDRDQKSRQRMQQLLDELAASHRQLQDYAARVAELAAVAERNRLARDIHDSLGHHLTAINIQLEKALAYRQRDPAIANQATLDAQHTARAALQDVRQSVSALRSAGERFSLKKALADLIGRMDGAMFEIEYHVEGDETDYASPVLTALYRVAQEGLTNVQKHAQARHVFLEIQLGRQEARLILQDDGTGFDIGTLAAQAASPERGFGIQGLRERLELLRGQMDIRSDADNGTEIVVTVPKNPAQLAAT